MNNVERAYDALASQYDGDYTTALNRAEEKLLRRLLLPYVSEPGRIINDLGCGTGLLLDMFPDIDEYLGIDISLEMLNVAHRKHPDRYFHHGDAWKISPHPSNLAISLFGSPSYNDIYSVVKGVKSHLQAGGRFFLMPLAAGRLRAVNGKIVDKHAGLWKVSSARQWRLMLEAQGAREVEICGFNLLRSSRLLRWETPLAKRFPDRCQYLIITGVM